jgi:beta-fructofuranosidase
VRRVLISETHWIWDSWVADDGDAYHLFYLQAPRSLGDAGRRHLNATVGHAVSQDLVSWEVLPEALGPTPGSWDDLSIWTGSSVLGDDGVWRMFYTATSARGYGVRDQRVGLAESDDLVTWRKVGSSPLLVADPRWYQTLPEDVTASETWRDPQVFRDPDGDGWHMLVTARSLTHGPDDDGVLAHARSHDLQHWELGPPVCESGFGFGQLEVAQVRQIEGRWVLVFTCHPQEMTAERRAATGDYCTWRAIRISLCERARRQVTAARLPPALSPETAKDRAVAPSSPACAQAQAVASQASSRAAGKGCSGASR